MTERFPIVGNPHRGPADARSFRHRILLIAAVSLSLRVSYVLFVKRHDALVGDEPYFHLTADWLAQGFGFTAQPHSGIPSALHPPLFSLLLTPVSWVASGSTVLAQRLVSAVLGTITVIVIGLLGREVAGERVGLFAAALAAISPTLWVNDGILMSESLAALMVTVVLLLGYRYWNSPTLPTATALGVACGLAALTRGELILLVVFVAAPLLFRRDWLQRGRAIACGLIATLFVVAPWAVYNISRFEQPVFISSNLGGTLCAANNELTYSGSELGLWNRSGCPLPEHAVVDQSDLSDFWTEESVRYARAHASRLPLVALVRLGRVLGVYGPGQMVAFGAETGARPRLVSWLAYGVFLSLVPFAFYGIIVLRRRHLLVAPLVAVIAMVGIVAVLLHGDVRYRVPADVALAVLAAVGLEDLTARWLHSGARATRRVPGAG